MKKFSRMIQGHQKGPAVVDIEFDESHNKFKKNLTDTDSLVNQMANFNKNVGAMKNNMAAVINCVEKALPPRAAAHEIALDARSVVDQYVLHSENFDRSFQILKDYQKFLHELQEMVRKRKKCKEEYEHYNGKAAELESVREERERFLRAQQNADKYGIAYASVTSKCMIHLQVAETLQNTIYARVIVGFMDAQAHNQVVAPCQNFVDMYRTHTEDPWPDVQDELAKAQFGQPADTYDDFDDAPIHSPSTTHAPSNAQAMSTAAAATMSPTRGRSPMAGKPTVPMVRALYDFTPSRDDELPLKSGDFVVVIQEIDEDWAMGRCAGKEGLFPISYTEKLS